MNAAQLKTEPDGRKAEDLENAVQLDTEPDGRKVKDQRKAAQLETEPDGRKSEELMNAAQLEAEPDGRKAEDQRKAAQLEAKPDGRKAKDIEEVIQLDNEPDRRNAKVNGVLEGDRERISQKDGILEITDGCVYWKGMLWVPNDEHLIQKILESEYNTKIAGHMGQDKTIELVRRNLWWPKMDAQIIDFVQSCVDCQKDKATCHQPYGLLNPLELSYSPWQSIAMDFITDLPESEGCNQLWVIIDRFTKMAHFIPLQKDQKTAQLDLVKIFVWEVFRLHDLPTDIVSARDSRFTSDTWKEFLKLLGIRPRMSTSFHPQTDGQTERVNQTIEAYLRSFINYEQDDWVDLMPTAEFAYNNSVTTATGISPFYANYGFHPATTNAAAICPQNPASKIYSHWIKAIHNEASRALEKARERMQRYDNLHRKDVPAYRIGDLVMLNGLNIQTRRPSRKLDHRHHGPFQIEGIISPLAVKLTLPRRWKIHNVFHVSLLEPFRTGTQTPPDPSKVLREEDNIENSEEYDIDEVMASTKKRRRVLYLVKWLDQPDQRDWTHEPFENFSVGGLEKLRKFHCKNPDAPRDYRLTN
jgi:hypothetical protein